MSEDRGKGISLRTKRKGRPAISAPKQISGPIQAPGSVPRSIGGQSSFEAPPQRPQVGGKVSVSNSVVESLIWQTCRHQILLSVGILRVLTTSRQISMLPPLPYPVFHLCRTNMPDLKIVEGDLLPERVKGLVSTRRHWMIRTYAQIAT